MAIEAVPAQLLVVLLFTKIFITFARRAKRKQRKESRLRDVSNSDSLCLARKKDDSDVVTRHFDVDLGRPKR